MKIKKIWSSWSSRRFCTISIIPDIQINRLEGTIHIEWLGINIELTKTKHGSNIDKGDGNASSTGSSTWI